MKRFCLVTVALVHIGISFLSAQTTPDKTVQKKSPFTEGIFYSRSSFPGMGLKDSLNNLADGNASEKYESLQALKEKQQLIKGENEQEIKDAYFISGIVVMPMYSKMYFSPQKSLVITEALGYHQETLINKENNTGMILFADVENTNQGTVQFNTSDLKEVWQKYQIDALQYSNETTSETATVAGYRCKKIIYIFNGTSRGAGVSNYIINMQPQRVVVWYTDDLPPSINLMHPHDFELQKAVLKYEVEYDKSRKNRMLVEVIKIEGKKIDEEVFQVNEKMPLVTHSKRGSESGMMIMQIMMNAISLLNK